MRDENDGGNDDGESEVRKWIKRKGKKKKLFSFNLESN